MSDNLQGNIKVAISADFFTAFASIQRQKQSKVVEFITKFRNNPMSPGINYEKINDAFDDKLRSVRIDDTYRGIVMKPVEGNVFILLWVAHHDEAYTWARRKKCIVNAQTGSIQVFDVDINGFERVEDEGINETQGSSFLFAGLSIDNLKSIGVPDESINLIHRLRSNVELESCKNFIPNEAFEALTFIAEGFTIDEVLRELFGEEIITNKEVNTADFVTALNNISSKQSFFVVSDDESERELKEMLAAPLEKWRVFLHPSQRRIVEKNYTGPARVLGGAGTGKTVVAMHRAKELIKTFLESQNDKILFTTFTVNLAGDIKENLKKLVSPNMMKRIEVINLDKWVSNFLKTQGYNYDIVFGNKLDELWNSAMAVAPDVPALPISFYREEWDKVIKPQEINKIEEYIKASRIGRGVRLDRKARVAVWAVFEELKNIMNDHGVRDTETAMMEARVILKSKGDILPYKAIIVDEGQDLSHQAYKLIREIAGNTHHNDIFIVGDAHQRIYGKKVVLSKCGVDIRGRSRTLKLNYRTTEETRNWAYRILNGVSFDDLDEGIDDSKGYKSLCHGPKPEVKVFDTFSEEIDFITSYVNSLQKDGFESMNVCLAARTQKQLDIYGSMLSQNGVRIYEIKRSKTEDRTLPGLRIATMHRVKGLEFDYVIIASCNDGIMPFEKAIMDAGDNVTRQEAEMAERSLLYVAATRAKKAVVVTGYGKISRFLE